MKVLVTGATGFVGSHAVARLLGDGNEVRVLARTPAKVAPLMEQMGVDPGRVEVMAGDITDRPSVSAALDGCDAVVHAAAVVALDPTREAEMDATNLAGATNVIDSALEAGCDPVIHVSSVAAFFPFRTDPVTPDHPVGGESDPYGRSKAACERLARRHQDEGKPVVTIYPSGVIGPDDWTESVNLPSVVLWLEKGVPTAKRISMSYVDVRDLAAVISASMLPGRGPQRLMATGTHVTAAQIAATIGAATEAKVKTLPTPQPVMWVWGRAGDLARRFGKDIVLTSHGYEYLFHSKPGDDAGTVAATGVTFRPLVDTFRDTFRWLHESGRIAAKHVGTLAEG